MIKKIVVIIMSILLILPILASCGNKENTETTDFNTIDISSVYEKYSSKIDSNDNLLVYLPVVTNKKITSVDIGNYIINTYKKDPLDTKSKLSIELKIDENQDELNSEYKDYYISFVKLKIEFENVDDFDNFRRIEFEETELFVNNEVEQIKIDYNYQYLEIDIVNLDPLMIDWNMRNILKKSKIQRIIDSM
ncbi:MAG: hypothetical protein WCR54_08875 [Clostridia bacterium]